MKQKASQLHAQLIQESEDLELGCRQFPDAYFMLEEYCEDRALSSLAISICKACPIKKLCLDYAMEAKEKFGIWGGKTPSQRQRARYAKN